jgi:periplasmic divalent cation tolerance protein
VSNEHLMILVTTFPDRASAEKVSWLMVDTGLAVCAQVGADLTSYFRWDGQVQKDAEVAVTFKVLGARFDLFCGELTLQHPYDVPQLMAWAPSYVNAPYADWAHGKGNE